MQMNTNSKTQKKSPAMSAGAGLVQSVVNFETLIYFDPATGAFRFDMTPRAPGTIERECSSGGAKGGEAKGGKNRLPSAATAAAESREARCAAAMHRAAAGDVLQTKPKTGLVDACGIGVELVNIIPLSFFGLQSKSGIFIDSVIKGRGASAARAAGGLQLQEGDQIIQAGSAVVGRSLQDAAAALVGERGSEIELLVERQCRRHSKYVGLWEKTQSKSSRFYITVTRS
jgi:hypothetical protein